MAQKATAPVDEVTHWCKRAEEAREMAKRLGTPGAQAFLLEIAESCDRLAEQAVARIARGARSTIRQSVKADHHWAQSDHRRAGAHDLLPSCGQKVHVSTRSCELDARAIRRSPTRRRIGPVATRRRDVAVAGVGGARERVVSAAAEVERRCWAP